MYKFLQFDGIVEFQSEYSEEFKKEKNAKMLLFDLSDGCIGEIPDSKMDYNKLRRSIDFGSSKYVTVIEYCLDHNDNWDATELFIFINPSMLDENPEKITLINGKGFGSNDLYGSILKEVFDSNFSNDKTAKMESRPSATYLYIHKNSTNSYPIRYPGATRGFMEVDDDMRILSVGLTISTCFTKLDLYKPSVVLDIKGKLLGRILSIE